VSRTPGEAIGVIGEGLLEVGFGPGVAGDQLRRGYGGDAANIAVMCAKMGTPSRLLTRVGDDAAGRALRSVWVRAGVSPEWVVVAPGAPTGN
jgi:sugar/nucleoside kinase (ribokinase family)